MLMGFITLLQWQEHDTYWSLSSEYLLYGASCCLNTNMAVLWP